MAKISIVVPIHNAADHLEESLSSIQNQIFRDTEIICVNDASEDDSADILQRFASEDERFQTIENEYCLGAGNTRNRGLERATSPYIVFFFFFEIYESSLLEKMYRAAVDFNADIVLAERGILNFDGKITPENSRKYENDGYSNHGFEVLDLPEHGLSMWPSSPINRMVRRDLIDQYAIRFQDLRSSNDVFYADMTMILANKIVHIEDWNPLIYVRRNLPGSISSNRDPFCSYQAFRKIKDELILLDVWGKYRTYVCMHYVSAIFAELKKCKVDDIRKRYYDFVCNEGIYQICDTEVLQYLLLSSRQATRLRALLNCDYSIRCWEENFKIRQQLYENRDRLKGIFRTITAFRKKATLWACGTWTSEIEEFVKVNYQYSFDQISSSGEDLVGMDIVLVANKADYASVSREAIKAGISIEMFALYEYLSCPSVEYCMKRIEKQEQKIPERLRNVACYGETKYFDQESDRRLNSNKIYSIYAEKRKNLDPLIAVVKRNHLKVAVWGENEENKIFIRFLRDTYCFEISYIVEAQVKTPDYKLENVQVTSITDISDKIDLIILQNADFLDSVKKRIREDNPQIQLLLLDEFLRDGRIDRSLKSVMILPEQMKRIRRNEDIYSRLEKNEKRLSELFYLLEDKKVGLWGGGIWGHELTKYAQAKSLYHFAYIIDNDPFLVGCKINGIEVKNFRDVYQELETVIITNRAFYEEIWNQIRAESDKLLVFELYRYLNGEDLNNCFS